MFAADITTPRVKSVPSNNSHGGAAGWMRALPLQDDIIDCSQLDLPEPTMGAQRRVRNAVRQRARDERAWQREHGGSVPLASATAVTGPDPLVGPLAELDRLTSAGLLTEEESTDLRTQMLRCVPAAYVIEGTQIGGANQDAYDSSSDDEADEPAAKPVAADEDSADSADEEGGFDLSKYDSQVRKESGFVNPNIDSGNGGGNGSDDGDAGSELDEDYENLPKGLAAARRPAPLPPRVPANIDNLKGGFKSWLGSMENTKGKLPASHSFASNWAQWVAPPPRAPIKAITYDWYTILLRRDPNRLLHHDHHIREKIPNIKTFEAIDSRKPLEVLETMKECGITLTDEWRDKAKIGHIACTCSHVKLWREVRDRNLSWALVLEDDAKMHKDFLVQVDHIMDDLREQGNPGWDFCYLFGYAPQWTRKGYQMPGCTYIQKAFPTYCLLGYLISRTGARKLTQHIEETDLKESIDNEVMKYIHKNKDTFLAYSTSRNFILETAGALPKVNEDGFPSQVLKSDKFMDAISGNNALE